MDKVENNYKNLIVWKKSMDLVVEIYLLISKLPIEEKYALSDQIRRASVSIPSNIAEGFGRKSNKEIVHFLYISKGSLYEVETQLILCKRLGYLTQEEIAPLLERIIEIAKLISSLIKRKSL